MTGNDTKRRQARHGTATMSDTQRLQAERMAAMAKLAAGLGIVWIIIAATW